jgi:phosphohistidine phosphatase
LIQQAACVPYRTAGDAYEILLITTRSGKWTIPKGIIDPGESPQQTAAKEAREEAGIIGAIEPDPIGSFTYEKWDEELHVQVYLLRVGAVQDEFDDDDFRQRRWFAPAEALEKVRRRNRSVVAAAVRILDERHR